MDIKRAREIVNSSGRIQVLHNGNPVWIENIKSDDMIEVTQLGGGQRQTVPVGSLVEKGV